MKNTFLHSDKIGVRRQWGSEWKHIKGTCTIFRVGGRRICGCHQEVAADATGEAQRHHQAHGETNGQHPGESYSQTLFEFLDLHGEDNVFDVYMLYPCNLMCVARCRWRGPVSCGWSESTVSMYLRLPQTSWGRWPSLSQTRRTLSSCRSSIYPQSCISPIPNRYDVMTFARLFLLKLYTSRQQVSVFSQGL